MTKYALGIDLGGTGTKFGLVNEEGQVLRCKSIPTQQYPNIDEYCDVLCDGLKQLVTDEVIAEACKELTSAAQPSFKYLDSVLTTFRANGAITPEAINTLRHEQDACRELARIMLERAGLNRAPTSVQQQDVDMWRNRYRIAPELLMLAAGGKRIRPSFVLMAYNLFHDDVDRILPVATALETYHNYTLLHDDLMDKADMRRGRPTVHKKWDDNTAILSGDTMLVLAYEHLAKCDTKYLKPALDLFTETALEVSEGQQFDMEFETRNDVAEEEYIEMIRLKTSVLRAERLKVGIHLHKAALVKIGSSDYYTEYDENNNVIKNTATISGTGSTKIYVKSGGKFHGKALSGSGWTTINILDYM